MESIGRKFTTIGIHRDDMFKINKTVIDLSETQQIWAHPGESLFMQIAFERDVSDSNFKFKYEERDWSFAPYTYTKIDEEDTSDWISLSNNNTTMDITIPASETMLWRNKTIEFQVVATEQDGFVWIPVDGTITIAEGV